MAYATEETKNRDDKIIKLFKSGIKPIYLAQRYQLSRVRINQIIKSYGLLRGKDEER